MIAKTGQHTEPVTNSAFGNLRVATTKLGPEVLASGWPEVGDVQRGQMSIALGRGCSLRIPGPGGAWVLGAGDERLQACASFGTHLAS